MIALSLAEIADITGGRPHDIPDPSVRIGGPVVIDSRQVEPGSLFAAFEGEHVDGHDYAERAVAAGAAAVLAARPVGVPAIVVPDVEKALGALARTVVERLGTDVVALTGSAGKTSTKDLIAQVLQHHAPTVWTPGSLNNEIGLPLTALKATAETRHLVLEMGARGIGHIAYLTGLTPPRIGLVLNVGTAHIGEFGGREAIAQAKGELVEALPAEADGGVAVLNADDLLVRAMSARTKARTVLFGEAEDADVRATEVRMTPAGQPSFTLHTPTGCSDVTLRLYGEHHVSNALAAAAVAHVLGMSVEEIATALSAAGTLSRWRMEVTERADGVTIVNDAYNANPESMRAALRALAAMGDSARARGGRTWAVLGPMAELGDAALAEHDAVGRLAVRLNVSKLVAVGGREASWLQLGAYNEGSWGEESVLVSDAQAAVDLLRSELRPGDVVLVKASRSIGLERVAQALLDSEGEVAGR
ncbi:UDP-N-acetylmuramoyl-tripeptide--D-alanyl-D-alanine ligase [Streptomyces lavendulae]|uniref:UDP-N-acetylmuramoyl-tripeptide--D-alanyl-D-alanine ligase n=1 Tax=Streptomyces lavendulae subsp. lavendulae TaxID=58340 RepID=A0A2K8PK87_STRLA|nr:UDP-N-acetylmuramoyl-tripeptide--D-alanyl-D-alanine ligase [Streptomyces lavendulae]ATZ27151.1 UDP-N-acetylmuramoyl-tripeptide--D-alanyl-D-alanine ligase [Streptomyces lavendulae subsp. lavendulae]QUQ56978.1 UDP-N-acetylmuramoyl-tripeptide--D-alanyl-D-alanine ligase [Streptomyces lavendulae subsp. lavendulae]GLV82818.1 UDP-N-acetylmuramoyl-tripeptide--D-alanyl-D-alanine ligase [Streptomyces lavendulae subsp. lavendulae]GLX36600.1 UDP-N-acetylmuramoyl-tripeptide--D-alanyl-D-alanine ligase [St